jgi:ADP-ribose pyrophosphatase YjhB (NUDIX family)
MYRRWRRMVAFTRDQYDRERYQRLRALAAVILAQYGSVDPQRLDTVFARQTGYATPKVDVRGAVVMEDRLLLVRECSDTDRWTLPGGWADVNESASESVIKEVQEEAGLEVRVIKLAAVWDRSKHPHTPVYPFPIWKLIFLCEILGGTAQAGAETSEVAFFAEDDLPTDLSTSRVLLPQLQRMFAHRRQPELPTEYD